MRVTTLFDQLLFSVTRVEVERAGNQGRRAVGTAFVVRYEWEPGKLGDFLVTAGHVAAAGSPGHIFFHMGSGGQPLLEKVYRMTIANWAAAWQHHPNPRIDVAVMPLGEVYTKLGQDRVEIFTRPLPSSLFATEEILSKLDSLEDIVFQGFPMGLSDISHLLPITRRGITATPLMVDYNSLPAFLIDASVFWGSSGSPVLIANQGAFSTLGGLSVGSRLVLLGVLSQLFARVKSKNGEVQVIPVTDQEVEREAYPINLGLVFKTKTITETIQAMLARLRQTPSAPPPSTGPPSELLG
jgi:hypothetical protein